MPGRPSRLTVPACLALAGLVAGCASAPREGRHRLKVVTQPPGARATLGEQSVVTPGSLWLAGFEPVTIRFTKAGCEPLEIEVRQVHHGSSPRNEPGEGDRPEPEPEPRPAGVRPPVPDGPVCGVPIPLVVGLLAGAAGRVHYDDWPERVEVRLDCPSEAPATPPASR